MGYVCLPADAKSRTDRGTGLWETETRSRDQKSAASLSIFFPSNEVFLAHDLSGVMIP
jgi:hypothetical protein